jgi:predicted nucleotidyltransferase
MVKKNNQTIAINKAKKFYETLLSLGYKINQMYLFGSYAQNISHKDSDIDIAIILESPVKNIFDEQLNLMRIAGKFEDSVIEVHPFEEKDFIIGNPFIDEIIRTGIRMV